MISTPTVLVIPYPAQGHVNPMMSFSHKLVDHGCNIIFVNSDFNHKRVVRSMENNNGSSSPIKLVSIPDGLGPEHDRVNLGELSVSILRTMPSKLEKLIEDLQMNEGIKVTCVVADVFMGWALEVAKKVGIKGAFFWPAAASMFVLQYNVPKLIADGILDTHGSPTSTTKTFWLSSCIPAMDIKVIWWLNLFDSLVQERLFEYVLHCLRDSDNVTDWWLCNSTYELEPQAFSCVPNLLPVGPLSRTCDDNNKSVAPRSLGQFWEEDLSCMNWLDQQQNNSVVYVAFGSIALFDQKQFTELALGLELMNRPFLWVVRQDPNCENKIYFPDEFKGNRGKIVGWAPQQKVLSHPAIACFVSHCGWNSTVEGLTNGVRFLCWPYFADQFFNQRYICDVLKVGLGFDLDENGLISRGEIKAKVDQLLDDENTTPRSHKLMEKLKHNIGERGASSRNLNRFLTWLKH
ncbi:hypothetical protein HN51_060120 [Arachis hypogaea]|uniref:UDP-glycosyltransferase 83A1 n=1 Tax=Arachis hypogaea TaxID=3818 RepID=UPI000DED535D|nr:UDP-glycosyltransferase 83A1 [Arachis hypogaea]